MLNWLRRAVGRSIDDPPQGADRLLILEREAQSLRLGLAERERAVASLRGELERQRNGQSAYIDEAVRARIERLMTCVAAPVAQLLTQAHLLEVEGRPVQAKDVLAVAKRLVRALEDEGLTSEGRVGESVSFDPNRHEPLGGDASIAPGKSGIIRFVGLTYRGELVRKAGVEEG
jgi:molecular chaperone GrpE (heat shock protein)